MENREFTLKFTDEQIKVIEAGLKELPGKFCLSVLETMFKQISEQVNSEKKETTKKDKK